MGSADWLELMAWPRNDAAHETRLGSAVNLL